MKDGPTVTYEGKQITLTKDNIKTYLGKVVTNFKENYEGTEEVNGITVSKKYRLYYVDFDGKYEEDGIGRGTIYLKAECISNTKELTLESPFPKVKIIKQLNPGLYKDEEGNEKTAPSNVRTNMRAVNWLLSEEKWSDLKGNLKMGGITQDDINYIVGAPSLEMMMDSYNTKYSDKFKKTDKPDTSDIEEGGEDRRKLFYKYTSGDIGYQVGPYAAWDERAEFWYETSINSVWEDSEIGTLYNPDSGGAYWLASPSSYDNSVHVVSGYLGGAVSSFDCSLDSAWFCPLVSLVPTAKLELSDE